MNKKKQKDKTFQLSLKNNSKPSTKNITECIEKKKEETFFVESLYNSSLTNQNNSKDDLACLHETGSSFKDKLEPDPFSFTNKSVNYSQEPKQDEGAKSSSTMGNLCQTEEIDLNNSSLIFQEKNEKFKLPGNLNRTSEICTVVDKCRNTKPNHDDILITFPSLNIRKDKYVEDGIQELFSPESDVTVNNQCPICFKSVVKYVNHVKSCAAKHKITTQQLLSAIKLQKKQLAERKELGLGVPAPNFRAKVSPKRSKVHDKKGPKDSSLELALALSASLRSAEEIEVIQEAEVLKEAGLTQEANEKLSILESHGFHSALGVPSRGASKPSSLLRRTTEERERIMTEKVAIVLINEEEVLEDFEMNKPYIQSKALKEILCDGAILWCKAHCPADLQREAFYVQGLSTFVSPSKIEVGQDMRHLSQLPGRLNTPVNKEYGNTSDIPTTKKGDNIVNTSSNRKTLLTNELENCAKDWKSLVNNAEFSDFEIRCKNSEIIPAHKLVFYVRCPSALTKMVESDSKYVLMWDDCPRTAIIALLEYIYSGSLSKLYSLESEYLNTLHQLAQSINCNKLKYVLEAVTNADEALFSERFENNATKRTLFETTVNSNKETDPFNLKETRLSESGYHDYNFLPTSPDFNNTHNSNTNSKDFIDERSRNGSPDMFDESKYSDETATQNDLEMLAALVEGTATSTVDNCIPDNSSVRLPGELLTNVSKRKIRRASSSSDDSCVFKKSRNEFEDERDNHIELSGGVIKDNVVFDLTQSSNSSNENFNSDGQHLIVNESQNKLDPNIEQVEDFIGDLTQKTPPRSSEIISSERRVIRKEYNNSLHKEITDPVYTDCCDYDNDSLRYINCDTNTQLKLDHTPKSECKESNAIDSFPDTCQNIHPNDEQVEDFIGDLTQKTPPRSSEIISSHRGTIRKEYNDSVHSDINNPVYSDWCNYDNDSWRYNNFDTNTPPKLDQIPKESNAIDSSHDSGRNIQDQIVIGTPKLTNFQSKSPGQYKKNAFDAPSSPKETRHKEKTVFVSYESDDNLHLNDLVSDELQVCSYFDKTNKINKVLEKDNSSHNTNAPQSHVIQKEASGSPQRNSFNAMQHLLDDTFEVNDSVFSKIETINSLRAHPDARDESKLDYLGTKPSYSLIQSGSATTCESLINKNKNNGTTPLQNIIVSDNVTPLPDYSAMKTPFMKRELTKFGIKPSLGKRKAKMMLRFIYDQTHPVVPDKEESENGDKGTLKSSVTSPCKNNDDNVNLDSDSEEQLSQNSSSTSISTLMEEDCDFEAVEDQRSQESNNVDIRTAIKNLIIGDSELHRKVVMYEAIFLEDLMTVIKQRKIRAKIDVVKEFLDEQCITFRTKSWKAINQKRRQRSPKKKTNVIGKMVSEGMPGSSIMPKKRGRPKKSN